MTTDDLLEGLRSLALHHETDLVNAAIAQIEADDMAMGIVLVEVNSLKARIEELEDIRDRATIAEELMRERAEAAETSNRILRGLVQTNPDWKCPHGFDVPTMGHCPSGFPGCACADDRIAVLCEDEERIVSALRDKYTRLETFFDGQGEELAQLKADLEAAEAKLAERD